MNLDEQKTPKSESSHTHPMEVAFETSMFQDYDSYLFKEGTHYRLFEKLGSHACLSYGHEGVRFGVWAPHASSAFVAGDFNDWDPFSHPLVCNEATGVWQGFIKEAREGQQYKFYIHSPHNTSLEWRTDPFGRSFFESASRNTQIWQSRYQWQDGVWLSKRTDFQSLDQPINIYEIHLGSWKRKMENGSWQFLSYRDLAEVLPDYLQELSYTHVEIMPIMEHPFYGSWGYQITGFFAPTSRYGSPDDFKYLIDRLHQAGIGVILDWVPSHFPSDGFGLHRFDGSHIFEYEDPRKGYHQDWGSYIFDYGRPEVRSFLISNAIFWLEEYHIDGLRVDAVASMIYLDYSRSPGEWVPNQFGGRENLEALAFLKQLNQAIHHSFPDVLTIAEESTAWPNVSRPVESGGLGFSMKWDMGWMHDTLKYFSLDPIHRKYHQDQITFRAIYYQHENFVLSLSHDEVVYGKLSMVNKMPGDNWQKFANLRSLFAYMMALPGKKLLFMGAEFGQWNEWHHDTSLDWHLLEDSQHQSFFRFNKDLNRLYSKLPALYQTDFSSAGFQWIDCSDHQNSVISFLRKSYDNRQIILCVFNLTPVMRSNYRIGVPCEGYWHEILNSDALAFGGSGHGNLGGKEASPIAYHGQWFSLSLNLPPLSALYFQHGDCEI